MALKKSKHINREISEGDKEPIWDGHIYFYKDTKRRNIDFVERIPVQVKGNDDNYKENVGYSISRNNLEHYLTEGGVLYFVVYLKDDSPTVTYASLTPKAIKKILLASDKKKKGRIISEIVFSFDDERTKKSLKNKSINKAQKVLTNFDNLSESQIKAYSSILSRTHEISDLAENKDYLAFSFGLAGSTDAKKKNQGFYFI